MKKNILIIISPIILLAIIAGIFYFLTYQNEAKEKKALQQEKYAQDNQKGQELFLAGKFSEASSYFEKASGLAVGYSDKGSVEIRLAQSYFFSGQREKALEILKKIGADLNYPACYRANALSMFLAHFYSYYHLSNDFFRSQVFSGDLKRILDGAGGNVNLAVKGLYEESIKLCPTAYAYYGSSLWYGNNALFLLTGENASAKTAAEAEKEEIIQKITENLSQGDKHFALEYQKDSLKGKEAFYYDLRARILSRLLVFNVGSQNEVNETFAKALAVYEKDATGFTTYNDTSFFIRFHWAAFIAEFNGSKGQNQIRELIKPIVEGFMASNSKQDIFSQVLINIKNERNQSYSYREALLVAKYSPGFKDILMKLGWSEEELGSAIIPLGETK